MSRKIKIAFALSALLYLCLLNWECTKIDTTNIGAGLIPAVDNVHTFDTTMEVIATNFAPNPFDTLACDSLSRHRFHVVGTISNGEDHLFGGTTASMYFQLLPVKFPYNFAAHTKVQPGVPDTILNAQFDSVILQLNYKKTWGDSTTPQTLSIYQLPTPIDPLFFKQDSTYNSCNTASPGTLLKTITFTPKDLNNMSLATDSSKNQLRIDLTAQLKTILYNQDSTKDVGGYYSDSLFKAKVLGGFAIVPSATGKALTYFDLDGQNTRLAIYYRYKKFRVAGAPEYDTIPTVSYFKFTNLAGERNTIIRDRSGAEIASHLSQPPAGDNFIYIQTSPGTYAKLKIPALNGFPNSLIHRAELVLDQVPDNLVTDSLYNAPQFLQLETLDAAKGPANTYRTIPCDFVVTNGIPNFNTFGGYRTTVTEGGITHNQYVFNISRYIQNFITFGKTDIKLRLTAPYHIIRTTSFVDECNVDLSIFNLSINDAAEGRVKFKGGNSATPKMGMHLRIIYSKL